MMFGPMNSNADVSLLFVAFDKLIAHRSTYTFESQDILSLSRQGDQKTILYMNTPTDIYILTFQPEDGFKIEKVNFQGENETLDGMFKQQVVNAVEIKIRGALVSIGESSRPGI